MKTQAERVVRISGCHECPYVYFERPKMVHHICAHPKMERRFGVSVFIAAGEIPKRCPLEVAK